MLAGKTKEKKTKNNQQNKKSQNSVFLNSEHKEQFLWFSCLFYSKCHSVSESAFGALRQRCKVQRIKYLRPRPNGVGFTRARGKGWGGGLGLWKITQQPPPANSKLLKTILTYCAVEGHCQISFRVSPAMCWMLLLKKALQ